MVYSDRELAVDTKLIRFIPNNEMRTSAMVASIKIAIKGPAITVPTEKIFNTAATKSIVNIEPLRLIKYHPVRKIKQAIAVKNAPPIGILRPLMITPKLISIRPHNAPKIPIRTVSRGIEWPVEISLIF
jgi:hypothetical protein